MTGQPTPRPVPRVEPRTTLRISAMVSATMLAMPATDLRVAVLARADRNPALVVRQWPLCARCAHRLSAGSCPRCGPSQARDVEPAATVSDWELCRQAALAAAPRELASVITTVLAALDERGLFTVTARQGLVRAGLPATDLGRAVDVLRAVGPPGIAEDTPAAALRAQLDTAPLSSMERALGHRLLSTHLALLEANDVAAIAVAEGCDTAIIQALLSRMSRLLRPYPLLDTDGATKPTRPPDLIFELRGNAIDVLVPESMALTVEVDPGFTAAARMPAAAAAVRDARAVVSQVQRRLSILHALGRWLGRQHAAALRAGTTAFGALTRAQAARELGVHESTISRAVADRTAKLLSGDVIPLRRMFGTGHDIRAMVAELCAAIPRPSDRRVAEILADRGIVLSRRTVAKYRLAADRRAR